MNNCLFCNRKIKEEQSLSFIFSLREKSKALFCTSCLTQFKPLQGQIVCSGCSRIQRTTALCQECVEWKLKYPKLTPNHQALFHYNERAKEFMELYKFKGDLMCAYAFSTKIRQFLQPYLATHSIVPIPISLKSQKIRGFNQVECTLERANIPFQKLLINESQEIKQTLKNKKMRLQTKQPFIINPKVLEKEDIKQQIVAVDDVYTTGRTIYHARAALSPRFESISLSLFR